MASKRAWEIIYAQPIMDVVVSKTKLSDTKGRNKGINSLNNKARNNVACRSTEEQKLKQGTRDMNP